MKRAIVLIFMFAGSMAQAGASLCLSLFAPQALKTTKYTQVPSSAQSSPFGSRYEEVFIRQAKLQWMKKGLAEVAEMYKGVVRSRHEFGVRLIESESELQTLKSGTIAIVSMKNAGPTVEQEIFLNSLQGRFQGWEIVNYDFEGDFYSDTSLKPQVVIYGKRTIRFPFAVVHPNGTEGSNQWAVDRILEAIELSNKPGQDQIWEVRTPIIGTWKSAQGNPNVQMFENMILDPTEIELLEAAVVPPAKLN